MFKCIIFLLYDYMIFSGLLHRNSTNSIVRNLHRILKLKEIKLSQVRQEVFNQIIRNGIKEDENHFHIETGSVTLTFEEGHEVIVDKQPLLEAVSTQNVPIENIKSIKAELMKIDPKDFLGLKILTAGGAVITHLEQKENSTFTTGNAWICENQKDLLENGKIEAFR